MKRAWSVCRRCHCQLGLRLTVRQGDVQEGELWGSAQSCEHVRESEGDADRVCRGQVGCVSTCEDV